MHLMCFCAWMLSSTRRESEGTGLTCGSLPNRPAKTCSHYLCPATHQITRPFLREPPSFSHVRYHDDVVVVVAFVVADVAHVGVVAFVVVVAAHVAHAAVFAAAGTS